LQVPKIEKMMGMEVYATKSQGIGGTIKHYFEDFIVEEILVNGLKAEVRKKEPLNLSGLSQIPGRKYLLCVLVKRNRDTLLTLEAIARQLGIHPGDVHIAGIKDKKAVTAQHVTFKGVSIEDLQKIHIKDVEVYPVAYFRSKLSQYYLLGNHFEVTVRGISHSKTTIEERLRRIIEEITLIGGIPNFFGHQRFGTIRPITHLVGKAIIQRNFRKAVMIFLAKPSPYENPALKETRKRLWKNQNFQEALDNFPKRLHYERVMLKHLTKRQDDFIGALRRLPKRLLRLFVQAYQAYLFNRFLSRRISMGLALNRAEVGDYVVSIETSGLPVPKIYTIASQSTISDLNAMIASGRKSVALPLIGFRQKFSQGPQEEIKRQILEEEGVSHKNFKIKEMPEISLKGGIRSIITPLNNFSLDEISRDEANMTKWKVKTSFMLHRGSYATVLLREIMKTRNPVKSGF